MMIPDIQVKQIYHLPAYGTWKETVHVFDARTALALQAAWLAERPLLVRGDPGTGKSQLARAAAVALGWELVSEVVSAHTEIQDLWYRFDAVSRLGQAQLLSVSADKADAKLLQTALDPKKFLSPGVLWWAYAWQTAERYYQASECKSYHPNPNHALNLAASPVEPPKGVVLLLDEIDKADADLPNSLLETLDNARFRIPWVNESIGYQADDPKALRPLVVITTNEDRQLPAAFVRRCLVLHLELPETEDELVAYLVQRGEEHFSKADGACLFEPPILEQAARQLYAERGQASALGMKPPGQAEYLDLLRVLARMNLSTAEQLQRLADIQDFALKKHPGMKQRQTLSGEAGEP